MRSISLLEPLTQLRELSVTSPLNLTPSILTSISHFTSLRALSLPATTPAASALPSAFLEQLARSLSRLPCLSELVLPPSYLRFPVHWHPLLLRGARVLPPSDDAISDDCRGDTLRLDGLELEVPTATSRTHCDHCFVSQPAGTAPDIAHHVSSQTRSLSLTCLCVCVCMLC